MKIETKVKIPLTAAPPVETYPVLAELIDGHKDDLGKVVLFYSQNVGTVVHSVDLRQPVSYPSCAFISPYCSATWRILPSGSEVIIKQS